MKSATLPANAAEAAAYGRRRTQRLRLGIAAELVLTSERQRCVIDDLSTCGAKVSVPAPPRAGASAILRWPGGEMFALVVWSGGGRCGLLFDETLSPEEVLAARRSDADNARHRRAESTTFARKWIRGET